MNKTDRFYDSKEYFRCPVCQQELAVEKNSLQCINHHCFDISKLGYVNFAINKKVPKHYSKETFENRMSILENGYYLHILNELADIVKRLDNVKTVLDIGCGEGYYSRKIKEALNKEVIAFDISKASIQLAAKNDSSNSVKWFVGDLARLPIKNNSIDCILDVFSPANYTEFNRVLTEGGNVIKVIPGNEHLKEIRHAAGEYIQKKEYSNDSVVNYFKSHYSVLYEKRVSAAHAMSLEDIKIFANMTPLLFHVDKSKIDLTQIKELTIDAKILVGTP